MWHRNYYHDTLSRNNLNFHNASLDVSWQYPTVDIQNEIKTPSKPFFNVDSEQLRDPLNYMAARLVDETKTGLSGRWCHSQPIQVSEA